MPLTPPLTPLTRDRLRQLLSRHAQPRLGGLRRVVATVLVLLAVVAWVRPPPRAAGEPTVPLLVAARDLAPGSTLRTADLRIVRAPESLLPDSALTAADQASGRVLAGAASRGEPLTSTRLVGRENTRLTTGDPSAVGVPVRLADPEVAALLTPGARIDVVTASPGTGSPGVVLAAGATVVTVRETSDEPGRLVVIAVPPDTATRLASVSLGQPVAVTLR